MGCMQNKTRIVNFNKSDLKDRKCLTYHDTRIQLISEYFTQKEVLQLSKCKWINLTQLILCDNNIGSRGCLYLSRASMNKLQYLDLGFNKIGNMGVIHLAKAMWLQLYIINFCGNHITNAVIAIAKAYWGDWESKKISLLERKLTTADFLTIVLSEMPVHTIILKSNYIKQSERQIISFIIQQKFPEIIFQFK